MVWEGQESKETTIPPKRATDSIRVISYKLYEHYGITFEYVDGIMVYPYKDDVRTHPTNYAVEKFKENLDVINKEEETKKKFIEYLKPEDYGKRK